jgi:hypothetical protein
MALPYRCKQLQHLEVIEAIQLSSAARFDAVAALVELFLLVPSDCVTNTFEFRLLNLPLRQQLIGVRATPKKAPEPSRISIACLLL